MPEILPQDIPTGPVHPLVRLFRRAKAAHGHEYAQRVLQRFYQARYATDAPAVEKYAKKPDKGQGELFSEPEGEGEGKHWITIGGHPGEGGKHHGGVHVEVEGGTIVKGPDGMEGKKVADLGKDSPKEQPHETPDAPAKRPAERKGTAVAATREGKGKEAKITLADGSALPAHITPSMIPPAAEDAKVYTDPESDVWVTYRVKNKNGKYNDTTIYNPGYSEENAAAKFYRTSIMLELSEELHQQNQANRNDPKWRDAADACWLMEVQATRIGGEDDTRGLAKHWGKALSPENIVITEQADKKGKPLAPGVSLTFGDESVDITQPSTKAEIIRRKQAGESLEDAGFWLKSYGATTLEGRHVVEAKDGVHLQFIGKEGIWHDHHIQDADLAKMLLERKASADEQGGKLFGPNAGQVSRYIKMLDTGRFSAKDYRTKRANELAVEAIAAHGDEKPKDNAERQVWINEVLNTVSHVLGNKPKQCYESYINPEVFSVWPMTGDA